MDQEEICLRLAKVNGLSYGGYKKTAQNILAFTKLGHAQLREVGLDSQQIAQFWNVEQSEITSALHWLEGADNSLLVATDANYPPYLATISRPPPLLFVRGDLNLLRAKQLAVVGSRDCSAYGRQWGRIFCQVLATSGLAITSGLAVGVDGLAHRATLDVEGKTIAVLGSGLQRLYPASNISIANEIVARKGVLISEFFPCVPPIASHFPRRNRIISGLSVGVLVVEASLKSGSLITARCALEQNRNVYAIPGALGNPNSEGVHWLIQQGALLVNDPAQILDDLDCGFKWSTLPMSKRSYTIDKAEVALPYADVFANVSDEVTPINVVAERAGQPISIIAGKLLELEIAGWIAAVPGGYIRLRRAYHA